MPRSAKELPCPPCEALTLTGVLAALSDPIRLAIIARLAEQGECAWKDLELPVGKSTLSHHVKVLREAGLIHHRKEGTRCFLSARDDLEQAFPGLLAAVLKFAPAESAADPPDGGTGAAPAQAGTRDPIS